MIAALVLRGPLWHAGVSAAVSIASAVQAALLWLWLRKRLQKKIGVEILRSIVKTAAAAGLAALAARGALAALGLGHGVGAALAGTLLFGAAFVLAALAVKSDELGALGALLRRKLARAR